MPRVPLPRAAIARRSAPRSAALWLAALLVCGAPPAMAADPADLAVDQATLAAKFDRLEALALRIAELVEPEDPDRAEQLRSAIRRSHSLGLADRFQAIVDLLESQRLAAADRGQQQIAEQLGELMQLLLADPREARAEADRKRLRELAREVGRLIQRQRELRNALFDGREAERIAEQQAELADRVREASEKSASGGRPADPPRQGEDNPPSSPGAPSAPSPDRGARPNGPAQPADPPGDGEPSGSPTEQSLESARRRLAQARQAMQQAIEDLEKQQTDQAAADQTDAQQRLEDARREIEEALEQLREEEQIRMLTRLATRFRRMLAEQTEVYELTRSTAEGFDDTPDRAARQAAAGLAERETDLVRIAEGALRLLEEDGQSVAFPETVEQVRRDMQQVADWLSDTRVGRATQELEEDILEQLETAIAAFEQAAADKQQTQQAKQQAGGQPAAGDRRLVDTINELRMIRSLQERLLRRTAMWDRLVADGDAPRDEAHAALKTLAKKQSQLILAAEQLERAGGR